MKEKKTLELPLAGESITIKVLVPSVNMAKKNIDLNRLYMPRMKCRVRGKGNRHYYLPITMIMIKKILEECQNNNISIDANLDCSIGREFTITGRHWTKAPKQMWKKKETTKELEPPTVYTVKLVV